MYVARGSVAPANSAIGVNLLPRCLPGSAGVLAGSFFSPRFGRRDAGAPRDPPAPARSHKLTPMGKAPYPERPPQLPHGSILLCLPPSPNPPDLLLGPRPG